MVLDVGSVRTAGGLRPVAADCAGTAAAVAGADRQPARGGYAAGTGDGFDCGAGAVPIFLQ